jgi:hypothetical protein
MEKAMVFTNFAFKVEGKFEPAGTLSNIIIAESKEEVRERFNKMKMEVVENTIRFYMDKEGSIAVAMDQTGKWEGYKRPKPLKGAKRLYPKHMRLVFEEEAKRIIEEHEREKASDE